MYCILCLKDFYPKFRPVLNEIFTADLVHLLDDKDAIKFANILTEKIFFLELWHFSVIDLKPIVHFGKFNI